MNFFNKYKNLFDVPDSTPFPNSKLSLDNNLFIEKPYVPTYKESYNLNSKLKQLKKDYENFEQQVNQLSIETPKRSHSRKGSPTLNNSLKKQKANLLEKKRGDWLYDEQKNLIKHSEMDFIFKEKMKKEYPRFENMPETTIPKMNNIFSSDPNDFQLKIKNKSKFQGQPRNNRIRKRNRSTDNNNGNQFKKNVFSNQKKDQALERRQEAKKNLLNRRQKLGLLLRTAW